MIERAEPINEPVILEYDDQRLIRFRNIPKKFHEAEQCMFAATICAEP